MLSYRLLRAGRRGLLGAVCAILLAPCASLADPSAGSPAPAPAVPATPAAPPPSSPADAARQLDAARQRLEITIEQYNALGVALAGTRQRSTALTAALVPVRQTIARLRAGIDAMAADLYMYSGRSVAALLGAPSPRALLDQFATAEYLARQRYQQVQTLQAAEAQYAARLHDLDVLAAQQAGQRAGLLARRTSIEAQIAVLRQLRTRAPAAWNPPGSGPVTAPPAVYAPGPAGVAVRYALAQLGKAYAWATDGPRTYDCSGLTLAAWRAAGVTLPHNAALQWRATTHIPLAQLRPGDLIFYYHDIHHVALYIGGGRMVHAPTYGLTVRIAPMGVAPIYGFGRPG